MTNLPETVQWVLDFLNINNTPGKPDLYRLPYELRSLRRPPIPQRTPNLELTNNGLIDKSKGYQWRIKNNKPEDRVDTFEVQKRLRQLEKKKTKLLEKLGIKAQENTIENMIEEWEKTAPKQSDLEIMENLDLEKDIEFEGINNAPTLADYKQFFLEKGIPPYKGKDLLLENGKPLSSLNIKSYNNRPKNNNEPGFYDYYQDNPQIEYTFYNVVSNEHCELSRILSNMVHVTKTYDDERKATEVLKGYMKGIEDRYLEFWKENEVPADSGRTSWGAPYRGRYAIVIDSRDNKEPFPHYGMFPHALYAYIMDFGINHKELLSRLKQCKYCGTFFIPEQKRGRPRKFYCPGGCQVVGKHSRKGDNSKKKEKRKKKRDLAKDTIIEYLMYEHFELKNNATATAKSEIRQKADGVYTKLPDIVKASQKNFLRYWRQKHGYATERNQ